MQIMLNQDEINQAVEAFVRTQINIATWTLCATHAVPEPVL